MTELYFSPQERRELWRRAIWPCLWRSRNLSAAREARRHSRESSPPLRWDNDHPLITLD